MEKIPDVYLNYINALNDNLKNSLIYYTGEGYDDLNRAFRRNNMLSNKDEKHFNNIMEIFEGGPRVRKSYTLYRGMNVKFQTTFEHKGLLSTTYKKKIAIHHFAEKDCCLYIITITPGEYSILPLESISENPEECEVILPPGKLSIQSFVSSIDEENEDNIDTIYCTYIPDNAEIIEIKENINQNIKNASVNLNIESWMERIIDLIQDEIKLLCEDEDENNFENCINNSIESLDFFNEIPKEAIHKTITFLSNIKNNL